MARKGSEQMKSNLACVDKLWNLVWEVVGVKALDRCKMNLHKVMQENLLKITACVETTLIYSIFELQVVEGWNTQKISYLLDMFLKCSLGIHCWSLL